jgi:hypothetical protein
LPSPKINFLSYRGTNLTNILHLARLSPYLPATAIAGGGRRVAGWASTPTGVVEHGTFKKVFASFFKKKRFFVLSDEPKHLLKGLHPRMKCPTRFRVSALASRPPNRPTPPRLPNIV